MKSYIKLYRSMCNWEWKDVPEMVALWVEILIQANYQENKWHGKTYEQGTFPTSLAKLSKATGLSVKQVRNCLERLEKSGEIGTQRAHSGTKISVINWELYQGCEKNSANEGQTKGTQRATLKEYKEINNIKEKKIYKRKESPFDEVKNENLKNTLLEFREMRRQIKAPLTDKAEELILNKLKKLAQTPTMAIAIVEQSILNNWKSVYAIKQEKEEQVKEDVKVEYNNSNNPTFTEEMRKRLEERRRQNEN